MDRMNTHPIPTEQSLRHWAEAGDIDQLAKVLAAVESSDSDQVKEVRQKVEAAQLRCDLAIVFDQAQQQLQQLAGKKPADLPDRMQQEGATSTTEAIRQFENDIRAYLESLHGSTEKVLATNERNEDGHASLSQLLFDQHSQTMVVRAVSRLGEVDQVWLRDQTRNTKDSVTELLWSAVTAGRDIIADLQTDKAVTAEGLAEWLQDTDESFNKADAELSRSVNYLKGSETERPLA